MYFLPPPFYGNWNRNVRGLEQSLAILLLEMTHHGWKKLQKDHH
jgi:hypothetical protein